MGKKKYTFFELVEGEKKVKKKQKLAYDPHKLAKEFYQNRKEKYRVKPKKRSIGGNMLKGNQVKLDKDGDGKISGNDFKMMKPKKPVKAGIGKMVRKMVEKFPFFKKKAMATSSTRNVIDGKGSPLVALHQKATEQKKARHGGYMKKANRGMMMEKPSTRGFGAARTSGMGLENESLQPGKIYDKVKAKKGKMAKASMGEFITVSEYSEDLI